MAEDEDARRGDDNERRIRRSRNAYFHIFKSNNRNRRAPTRFAMETYLTEIKQLRIPRPKFEPNSSPPKTAGSNHHHLQHQHHHHHHHNHWRHFVRPFTPPRDYHVGTVGNEAGGVSAGGGARPRTFQAASEELRTSS